MSATAFTYPLAKRIVASNAWVEQQRGIMPADSQSEPFPTNGIFVRTNSTAPTGYSGAMAFPGEIVTGAYDGTWTPVMPVWIKDQNGQTLDANTIYQGRLCGNYTQDTTTNGIVTPTTQGLYLVQKSGGGSTGVSNGQVITGIIGTDQNGKAIIYYYPQNGGPAVVYTLTNISGTNWRVTTIRRSGVAIVVDSNAMTAQLSFFSPIMWATDCKKIEPYRIIISKTYANVSDPFGFALSRPLYNSFLGLIFDSGDIIVDPVLVNAPAYVSQFGISTGISPGISGV